MNNISYKKLNIVAKLIMGQSPPSETYNENQDGYMFLQGKADFGNLYPNAKVFCTAPKKLSENRDLLISVRAPVGDINISNDSYCIGRGLAAIRSNSKILDYKYLYYYLLKSKKQIADLGTGSTFKAISKSILSEIKIPVPSLPIQKKIVDVLDKAQELIDLREKQIKLLDELVQSVFYDMFGNPVTNPKGWERLEIGKLCDVKTGGTPSRKVREFWMNPTIPWVKTNAVVNGVIKNTEEMINEISIKKSNVSLFPKNTILIAMYGQGKTRGRVGKLAIEATTNQACAALLPSNKLNEDFLFYYLKFSYNKLRNLGRGGNQPNLNLNLVKTYQIILPHLKLQKEFAKKVEKIESQKELMQQSLQEMKNNYNSLIQRAFKGELF